MRKSNACRKERLSNSFLMFYERLRLYNNNSVVGCNWQVKKVS